MRARKSVSSLRFRPLVCAALLFTGCGAGTPRSTVLARPRIELPTAVNYVVPVVTARVNGAGPFWFIVDSGSQRILVTEAVVAAAKLKSGYTWNFVHIDALGRWRTHRSVGIDRVELDQVTLNGMHATVVPDGPSPPSSLGPRYGGVLGIEAFSDVFLEIDYRQKKISLSQTLPEPLMSTTASTYRGFVPSMPVTIAGKEVRALIDTGSGYALNVPDLADWPTLSGGRGTTVMDILGQPVRRDVARLRGEMQIGPLKLPEPQLVRAAGPRIGSPAFAGARLVFDHGHKRLWVIKDP